MICFKEFRDKFNLHTMNTTNNSILLHTQSILTLDSIIDISEYMHLVTCRYKNKDNITIETFHINTLNEISNSKKNKKY